MTTAFVSPAYAIFLSLFHNIKRAYFLPLLLPIVNAQQQHQQQVRVSPTSSSLTKRQPPTNHLLYIRKYIHMLPPKLNQPILPMYIRTFNFSAFSSLYRIPRKCNLKPLVHHLSQFLSSSRNKTTPPANFPKTQAKQPPRIISQSFLSSLHLLHYVVYPHLSTPATSLSLYFMLALLLQSLYRIQSRNPPSQLYSTLKQNLAKNIRRLSSHNFSSSCFHLIILSSPKSHNLLKHKQNHLFSMHPAENFITFPKCTFSVHSPHSSLTLSASPSWFIKCPQTRILCSPCSSLINPI